MSRYFITLSYNGKNYVGWQIQPNGMSVQQMLQDKLSTLLRGQIDIVGAGRTDAGVHAHRMTAHFDWQHDNFSLDDLVYKLNRFLPSDIAIHRIQKVKSDAHARFSALSRTYKYYIANRKDPFYGDTQHRVFFEIDVERMNEVSSVLKDYTDFTSFSRLHSDNKTNICHIQELFWERVESGYVFTITADRFLRNMVRAIVGTLLLQPKGRLDVQKLRTIIEAKDRSRAGDSAPAHALFLHDVIYPNDIWL